MTNKRKKKAVSPPKKVGNKAKSTTTEAKSKKAGEPNPKAQTAKKTKTTTGKINSTTVKQNKQKGSNYKVQPTQQTRTSPKEAGSTTVKPSNRPKVQQISEAKISPAKASSKKKKTISTKKLVSEPKVDRNVKRNAKVNLKASSVRSAFNKFQSKIVDLGRTTTEKGRNSHKYLFLQVNKLANNYSDFPRISGGGVSFGSFARRTKIRPLDDIDLMILLNGRGIRVEISYEQKASGYGVNMTSVCQVKLTDDSSPFKPFSDDKGYVNSIRILNRIKYRIAYVTNYKKADKNRQMQAVTLNLKSLPWTFDIVPAIPIYDCRAQITCFLIPDGYGKWIRTNPKIAAKKITSVNTKQKGKLLPVIRLLKYWNKRKHKPILSSYYFETLVVQTFQNASEITSYPAAIEYFFQHCSSYIMGSCPDPTGLGEALDVDVSRDTKLKILKALRKAAIHANHAMMAESQNEHKTAIYWWKKVFGSEFPDYD